MNVAKRCHIRERVNVPVIEVLEADMIPWRTPQRVDANCGGMPIEIVTGARFNGIQTLLLQIAAQENGWISNWWGTKRQWDSVNAGFLHGNVPTTIPVVSPDGEWQEKRVFNAEQCFGPGAFGLKPQTKRTIDPEEGDYRTVRRAIFACRADMRLGVGDENHAPTWCGYIPPMPWDAFPHHTSGDYILAPKPSEWQDLTTFYSSLLHELIHWAEVRTGWRMIDMHPREFVAEMGSGWLATMLQMPACPYEYSHFVWRDHWVHWMKRDDEYLWRGVAQVEKAVNFILGSCS